MPIRMIMTVPNAPRGRRNFYGMRLTILTIVLFHALEMAWVTGLMDTWNVTRRIVMQSQRRNGINQPRSPQWRTKPAIHHLGTLISHIRLEHPEYAYPVNKSQRKTWKKILYLA